MEQFRTHQNVSNPLSMNDTQVQAMNSNFIHSYSAKIEGIIKWCDSPTKLITPQGKGSEWKKRNYLILVHHTCTCTSDKLQCTIKLCGSSHSKIAIMKSLCHDQTWPWSLEEAVHMWIPCTQWHTCMRSSSWDDSCLHERAREWQICSSHWPEHHSHWTLLLNHLHDFLHLLGDSLP